MSELNTSWLQESVTWYMGKREKVARLFIGNEAHVLSLADTRMCARSFEHCVLVLRNLGGAANRENAYALMAHCRALTKYKEGFYTKENPGGVKRDKPRRTYPSRRFLID